MGEVAARLHEGTLAAKAPVHYAGTATVELAETIHLHRRNLRLELSADEFRRLVGQLVRARARWSGEEPSPGRATEYLDVDALAPEPPVAPDRLAVEVCRYPTIPEGTVHVHYRDLRIEFSPAEWEEFARAVVGAWDAWVVRRHREGRGA